MNERLHNEIIRLAYGGTSRRRIARMLKLSRKTVRAVLAAHEAARRGEGQDPALPRPRARRRSLLDPFEDTIRDLLKRYPDITAVRLLEELRDRGFTGRYTIVQDRLRTLRPPQKKPPVVRFETGPGEQAQMDYSPYTLEFTAEGRRRVHAFSYVLGYSRRQYLRFVEREDFPTTLRQHVQAFHHLGGVAATCLYDNMKVVVSRFDGDEPIYNPRFLAFATHYGFRPWACRRRRGQTKGKVERPFDYLEKNLLNARTFRSLEHLNEVAAWWLEHKADVRIHRETRRRPVDLHAEEKPHLVALPDHDYELAQVVYRFVNAEGYVAWRQNHYSAPWRLIGEYVPVRITGEELILYGNDIRECGRHPLFPGSVRGQKSTREAHRPRSREKLAVQVLAERFEAFGPPGRAFLDGVLKARRYGRTEAARVLELLALYRPHDLTQALERAVRYGAFSYRAIERILAVQATPRPPLETLGEASRASLRELLDGDPVTPRATAEYQGLLGEEDEDDGHAQDGRRAQTEDGEIA